MNIWDKDNNASTSDVIGEIVKSVLIPGYGLKSGVEMTKAASDSAKKISNDFSKGLDVIGNGARNVWNFIDRVSDNAIDRAGRLADKVEEALGLGDGSPETPGINGRKYYGGSGSVPITRSSSSSAQQSYLDMLHQEQERVWQREDTAYQRTVADLKQAGLNPVLAVGSGMQPAGGSSSSDAQVLGAVSDLAAMAISGLTETAKGIGTVAASSHSDRRSGWSWYKDNAKTINTAITSAAGIAKLIALL